MYVITGNDDVFALNAKTGESFGALVGYRPEDHERLLRLGQSGLAMGEGMLFLGQFDANVWR